MFERLFQRKQFQYKCHECGKTHTGSPSFSYKYPEYYFDVPRNERETRVLVNADSCKISPNADDASEDVIYCIRVILEIPIRNSAQPFTWGVWVSQSKNSFDQYVDTFDCDQSTQGSFGWLMVNMPFYSHPETNEMPVHLECDVEFGPMGQRPKIRIWDCNHPLSIDQREGISWRTATKIANMANSQFLRTQTDKLLDA